MAKKRLNQGHRAELITLARSLIRDTAALVERDVLRKYAIDLFREEHDRQFPQSDMDILEKYNEVFYFTDPYYSLGVRPVVTNRYQFVLTKPETLRVPEGSYKVGRHIVIDKESELYIAIENTRAKNIKINNTYQVKIVDYKKLINSMRYYEDLVDIWPEAISLKNEIMTGTAIATVADNALILRIKADVETRSTKHEHC